MCSDNVNKEIVTNVHQDSLSKNVELNPFWLTTYIIQREYERTHPGKTTTLSIEDFTISDLKLSIDDFSEKQGWMKKNGKRHRI